jgi:ATP-dependent Clp protease ATP-binding subunit ClpA
MQDMVKEEVKEYFSPEFLNRLDQVIVFRALNHEDLKKIVKLQIKELEIRLKKHEIPLAINTQALEYIAQESFNPAYGARPVRRTIQELIENYLSEQMLIGKLKKGDKVSIGKSKKEEKLSFSIGKKN